MPQQGEVWLIDLGLAAKVRPCLVVSIPPGDVDRALVTVIPQTTAIRGSKFEVALPLKFTKSDSVFDAQNLISVPLSKPLRRLGKLTDAQLEAVQSVHREWLALKIWKSFRQRHGGASPREYHIIVVHSKR